MFLASKLYIFDKQKTNDMRRFTCILVVAIIGWAQAFATNNRPEPFSLRTANNLPTVQNSLYNSISFLNSKGFSQSYPTDFEINDSQFSMDITNAVNQMIDRTAQYRNVLFQLRDLSFYIDGFEGKSHVRATLYESTETGFLKIGTLDTDIEVQSGKNLLAILKANTSAAIIDFISQNLTNRPINNVAYSLEDIQNIDNIEKISISLYDTNTYYSGYKEGIYYTFDSFIQQQPIKANLEGKYKKEKLTEVKYKDQDNKFKKISPDKVYAVVLDNIAYIAYNNKYYRMYLDNGDLCFDVEEKSSNVGVSPSFGIGIGSGGYRGGGLGIGITTRTQKQLVTYKIDHINGKFIPINYVDL